MCTDQHDDDVDAIQICRISESVDLFATIDIALTAEACIISHSVELFTHIETARSQDAVDDAFIKTPELQDINRLFAQIDFEHQQLRKINDPEASICENITGILDTPLPGVECWKTKTRINCKTQRKTKRITARGFVGPSLCGVQNKILKQKQILAGLFDNMSRRSFNQNNNHY